MVQLKYLKDLTRYRSKNNFVKQNNYVGCSSDNAAKCFATSLNVLIILMVQQNYFQICI